MNLDLQGKHAVVCGASQGIGRASAVELALLGATVTLIARNEARLREASATLSVHAGQSHRYLAVDFTDWQQVKIVIEKYAEQNPIHILINNTGGPPAGLAIDARPEEFVQAFSSHLLCNQVITQAVVPGMKAAGFGRIVNIISTSVKVPLRGLGVSNTIRAAVANWAKTLSVELAPAGITVNNVLPGATMTARLQTIMQNKVASSGKSLQEIQQEMVHEVPAGRIGEAHEVAAAVAFLCSPAAAYINGINLPVDGGRTGSL